MDMKEIIVVPYEDVDRDILEHLKDKLSKAFSSQVKIHEKLKIPRARLNDLLAPGKVIVKDLDMEQAQKMLEELSMDGIELIIKLQLNSEDKKYIWAVVLMLISIIAGIWSMKFKVMDEPEKTQFPTNPVVREIYEKCERTCEGDSECIKHCLCLNAYLICEKNCTADEETCRVKCLDLKNECLGEN